jgi:hypothetical protein
MYVEGSTLQINSSSQASTEYGFGNTIKNAITKSVRRIFPPAKVFGIPDSYSPPETYQLDSDTQVSQRILFQNYQLVKHFNLSLPKFQDVGFRIFSQSDEDGILLYVFSMLGTANKICVDLGAGNPRGANTTNLIRNWGWTGFLIEADESKLSESAKFYAGPDTNVCPPTFKLAKIDRENVNELLRELGVTGQIDLLSLDIDGIDYWVWESLVVVQPTVVICEYSSYWGPNTSVTIPYDRNFSRPHPNYWGASLAALVKLGNQKGYRLVGCNRYGYNAIFVRKGFGDQFLPEVSHHDCLADTTAKRWRDTRFIDFPDIQKFPWVEV